MPPDGREGRPPKKAAFRLDTGQGSSSGEVYSRADDVPRHVDTDAPAKQTAASGGAVGVDQLEAATVEAAADEALTTNRIVTVGGYALVPDVIMAEAAANGHDDPPPTLRLVRADGRVAHLYALPAGVAS